MAWKTTGDVVTAADMNATAVGIATSSGGFIGTDGVNSLVQLNPGADEVLTKETTTSTTYTDLATVGPAVTVTTGPTAWVAVSALLSNASGVGCDTTFAVSGATTRTAKSEEGVRNDGDDWIQASYVTLVSGLTPGSNTFTMEYRAITSGTASFDNRRISVIPIG